MCILTHRQASRLGRMNHTIGRWIFARSVFVNPIDLDASRVRPPYPADCLSYARRQVPKSTTPLKIVE
jgi:hypothetical protein